MPVLVGQPQNQPILVSVGAPRRTREGKSSWPEAMVDTKSTSKIMVASLGAVAGESAPPAPQAATPRPRRQTRLVISAFRCRMPFDPRQRDHARSNMRKNITIQSIGLARRGDGRSAAIRSLSVAQRTLRGHRKSVASDPACVKTHFPI